MEAIILPADDATGDWRATASLRFEPDGTVVLSLVREWRDDFEPDDFSEQERPQSHRH